MSVFQNIKCKQKSHVASEVLEYLDKLHVELVSG